MFAQPDEYLTLVFSLSLIAIVFWYRRKARSQLLPLITESGLLVHLYLNAARDLNHIKVQGQFSSEFQVREINWTGAIDDQRALSLA
jgi:hypothetical protein